MLHDVPTTTSDSSPLLSSADADADLNSRGVSYAENDGEEKNLVLGVDGRQIEDGIGGCHLLPRMKRPSMYQEAPCEMECMHWRWLPSL